MAPIKREKVEVTIEVDGNKLAEYIDPTEKKRPRKVNSYIKAQDGQFFSIKQVVKAGVVFRGDAIYTDISIDGERYDHFYLYPDKTIEKQTTIEGVTTVEKIRTIEKDHERIVAGPRCDKSSRFCFNGIESCKSVHSQTRYIADLSTGDASNYFPGEEDRVKGVGRIKFRMYHANMRTIQKPTAPRPESQLLYALASTGDTASVDILPQNTPMSIRRPPTATSRNGELKDEEEHSNTSNHDEEASAISERALTKSQPKGIPGLTHRVGIVNKASKDGRLEAQEDYVVRTDRLRPSQETHETGQSQHQTDRDPVKGLSSETRGKQPVAGMIEPSTPESTIAPAKTITQRRSRAVKPGVIYCINFRYRSATTLLSMLELIDCHSLKVVTRRNQLTKDIASLRVQAKAIAEANRDKKRKRSSETVSRRQRFLPGPNAEIVKVD